MSSMSYVFFGLMLLPLVIFLIWIIKKDKNKNYLGLAVLVIMAIAALYTIVKIDSKFMETRSSVSEKSQAPSYR